MKLRSLRPVVLGAARARWPLPLVVLVITLISRVMDPGRVPWVGSEMHSVFAAVIYGALIPLLVIALASSWLRGDDAPWAWAFARPVTRSRWLRTTLVVDALTVALCVGLARWVLGGLPHAWIGGWFGELERVVGYGALLVTVYAAAAFAGARGATAIGAGFCVAIVAGFTMATHAVVKWLAFAETPRTLLELPSVPTLAIIAVAAAIATRRAAAALPSRPRLQDPTGLAAIAVALALAFPWLRLSVVLWWIA